jgi:hypothetical protein
MRKIFVLLGLLASSTCFSDYDDIKKELVEKLQMYENLRDNERSLYGQWYLGGVITGLENALFIIHTDQDAMDYVKD